jgi:hypothetical protein
VYKERATSLRFESRPCCLSVLISFTCKVAMLMVLPRYHTQFGGTNCGKMDVEGESGH